MKEYLVAIGASAGGPAALATILSSLPPDFGAAIVVVQHIDEQFVPSMVSWLKEHSRISVRIACPGDRPQAGVILVAGTNDHLSFVSSLALGYTPEPRECSYRPCVDVFFESILRHWRGEVAGVLLSGMGRDGALGLKKLRNCGAVTIAQDAATSSVYGMPKAAVELNAAVKILPADRIAGELVSLCAARKQSVPHDKH
jgi:two-component system response regulator WspF